MALPTAPAHAGHAGVPTPALARSQPRHPSNHLHGSRTSLFLVESERLFKDSTSHGSRRSGPGAASYPFLFSGTCCGGGRAP